MATVRVSCVIDAPVAAVWAVLREFNGMPVWHPAVKTSVIDNGVEANAPGAIRALTFPDGGSLREKLESLNDEALVCTYSIVEGAMPVTGYLGTLSVRPVTADNRTFVEWGSTYTPTLPDPAAVEATIRNVYETGLDGLAAALR
jgi:hypothetical protein